MTEAPDALPKVSVIIPVYNGEALLPRLIESISRLDYPRDKMEVILVDNNSTDRTAEIIKESGFTYLMESGFQSSYAARNRGADASTGQVLAFTDADSWADPQWLRKALDCMKREKADLVAGKVEWVIKDNSNVIEIFGRYQFERQAEYVKQGFCGTGNLLIQRAAFEKLGGFDSRMVSSGDKVFSSRASDLGFKLVFCENAKVYHETRKTLAAMRRKSRRIGFGLAQERYYHRTGEYLFYSPRWWLPGLKTFREIAASHQLSPGMKTRLFFTVWLCKIEWALGNLKGFFYVRRGKTIASKDQ